MNPFLDHDFNELSFLGLVGVFISYIEQKSIAKEQGKKFSFRTHYLSILLNIVLTLVTVYLRVEIKEIYVITKVGAVLLGYSGSSFIIALFKSKVPKI